MSWSANLAFHNLIPNNLCHLFDTPVYIVSLPIMSITCTFGKGNIRVESALHKCWDNMTTTEHIWINETKCMITCHCWERDRIKPAFLPASWLQTNVLKPSDPKKVQPLHNIGKHPCPSVHHIDMIDTKNPCIPEQMSVIVAIVPSK